MAAMLRVLHLTLATVCYLASRQHDRETLSVGLTPPGNPYLVWIFGNSNGNVSRNCEDSAGESCFASKLSFAPSASLRSTHGLYWLERKMYELLQDRLGPVLGSFHDRLSHMAIVRWVRRFAPGFVKRQCARARLAGARAARKEGGIELQPEGVIEAPFSFEGGWQALRELRRCDERPSVLICGTDLQEIGVLDEYRVKGVAVPEQLSVTDFDDIELAAPAQPTLRGCEFHHWSSVCAQRGMWRP
jgi:hypothetical protein